MAEKKAVKKVAKKAPAKPVRAGGKTAAKKAAPKKDAPNVSAGKEAKTDPKRSGTFAVIATGGKQYVVHEGEFLNIEKLSGEHKEGAQIELEDVLLVDDGKSTKVGDPTLSSAKVIAEFVETGRAKKIEVIRFRSKSRYFKNRGHRQAYTRIKVIKIG
jgi:large subunit ribosomal protein L21